MDDDGGMEDQGQRPNPFAGGRWDPPPLPGAAGEPALVERRDRGSPQAAIVAGVAIVVLVLTTFVMQQMSARGGAAAEVPTSRIVAPRPGDMDAMSLKSLAKVGRRIQSLTQQSGGMGGTPELDKLFLDNLDGVYRPESRLRAAVVVGEMAGASEAQARLVALRDALDDPGERRAWSYLSVEDRSLLAEDTQTLLDVYDGRVMLEPSASGGLQGRHGYFGKVVSRWGWPADDAERAELLSGGPAIFLILISFGLVVAFVVLGGFAAFITMLVLMLSGRIRSRFVPPMPGGSVYLETVALFFLAFLLLHVGMGLAVDQKWVSEANSFYVSIALQWALLPIIAWPIVRGTGFTRWRREIGLHSGEGVFKELLCGAAGYLAGVPVLLAAMVVSIVAVFIKAGVGGGGGSEPPAVENPIVELVSKGGWAPWLLFALATVWAPIVEECIFRGAMYRHLRRRLGVLLTAVVVAFAFGTAHGYEWMMLGPVIALGFNFSLMREWRGSLIGPIAAHCLHNATVLLLVISLFSLLKD